MKKILFIIFLLPLLVNAQITVVKDHFQQFSAFMNYNNQLFFFAYDGTNSGLFKTDGTANGTVFVKTVSGIEFSGGRQPVVSGGLLYFTESSGTLWRTDGTTAGTFQVSTVPAFNKIDLNGILIFTGRDVDGDELWRTDGTLVGTYKIADFNPGSNSGVAGPMYNMAKQGNYIYFAGVSASFPQNTLCRTDGTEAGTQVVANSGFSITDLAVINNKIVYVARVDYTYYSVNSNGVVIETYPSNQVRIMKVENGICGVFANPGAYYTGSYPSGPYVGPILGGDLDQIQIFRKSANRQFFKGKYYAVYNNQNNSTDALFVTDGSITQLLKIFPAVNFPRLDAMETFYWSRPISIDNTFLGDIFYFVAGDDNTGHEVWRSDGTQGGTFLLKDIYPGAVSSEPKEFRTVNGITYFIAGDGAGRKLFQTDGTTVGTVPVTNPNNVNPYESSLSSTGNNLNRFSNVIGNKFLFVGASNLTTGDGIFVVENCQTNSSLFSGSWSASNTWSCGHAPLATETVEIGSGHVINLNANSQAKNINLLGILNLNNFEIKLNGN